jgi:hypothetical protein
MAKWVHQDVLDGGLNAIKNGATRMLLLKAYTLGDSYATVVGNAVASATMTSADYTISSSGSNRVVTNATKSATASAAGDVGDSHIAHTDGSSKVLWVTDETGETAVAAGDTVNFPALTYTALQPT